MHRSTAPLVSCLLLVGPGCVGDLGDVPPPSVETTAPDPEVPVAPCEDRRAFFALQVWPTIKDRCMACHSPGGEGTTGDNAKQKTAGFVLQWETQPGFLEANIAELDRMIVEELGDVPKLLLKPTGGDSHLGGAPIDASSDEFKALERFATMSRDPAMQCDTTPDDILATVPVVDWNETFRRAAMVIGGRLATATERDIPDETAFDDELAGLLREEGFVRRMKTYYNDALLTEAGPSTGVGCVQFPADVYPRAEECQDGVTAFCTGLTGAELTACSTAYKLRWSMAQRALRDEPLELVANVVRKERPFTEILTADYAMVNPYSALLYNLEADYDEPTPLTYGDWREQRVVAGENGDYPHAGILSTPGFLGRWLSTPTNRDRGRARVVHDVFLATDVLTLAQRPIDASALTAVANAPRNAAACSSCHTTVDPVANAFSAFPDSRSIDFDPLMTAATNRHQEMLPPGFGSEVMPGDEREMLAWLSDRIVADERFSLSVTRLLYRGILGRQPLPYPSDVAAADHAVRFAAWDAEDRFLHEAARAFRESNHDVRVVASRILKSPFLRAAAIPDGFNPVLVPRLGGGRLLPPEVIADKLQAVFGAHWGTWDNTATPQHLLLTDYEVFYGGIDSLGVTERLATPNALFASTVERMGNEMACRTVAWDLTKPADERLVLPLVDIDAIPGSDEQEIRANIQYLIEGTRGVVEPLDGPEVEAAYQLFAETYADLAAAGDPSLPEACQGKWDRATPVGVSCSPICSSYVDTPLAAEDQITDDATYTIRAWMAVVSYLVADYRFLCL